MRLKKKSRGTSRSRAVEWIFILFLIMTCLMNILFIIHSSSTAKEKVLVEESLVPKTSVLVSSPSLHLLTTQHKVRKEDMIRLEDTTKKEDLIKPSAVTETRYLDIDIYASKTNVTFTLNGRERVDTSEMLLIGLNVLVLNEVTGAVMSSRWFDTYASKPDSDLLIEYLNSLKLGRIICFATKDEATVSLSTTARALIRSYGSSFIKDLNFREMWSFVVQRFDNFTRPIVYGESVQKAPTFKKWGSPVRLRTSVKLLPQHLVKCKWDDSELNGRRRAFCDKYEGYGDVCSCDNPLSLEFNPQSFPDETRFKLPVAVMAGNRPAYLLRMLLSLRNVQGLDPELVTVHIDGLFDEPASVAMLFGLSVEQHQGSGKLNSRICQHYKKSLTASFDRFPDANHLVILEDDLETSVDILSYFAQLLPVLENDKSVYCISAWNDQGYDYLSNDPAMMYRVETMPGLGWVLSRELYKGELEPKWPKPGEMWDWDIWMRNPSNRKGRECIVPDISRTYHFGAKGLNVGSYMQEVYFKKHAINKEPDVKFDADTMYKDAYENELMRLLSKAKVLDHSKTPCANRKDFVPDPPGQTYVFYLRMDTPRDYTTWSNVARCLKMWDLNPRGFHNNMWRFWIKKNHILAVGCPASVYCSYKPEDVTPIYLPDKVTRPKDDD